MARGCSRRELSIGRRPARVSPPPDAPGGDTGAPRGTFSVVASRSGWGRRPVSSTVIAPGKPVWAHLAVVRRGRTSSGGAISAALCRTAARGWHLGRMEKTLETPRRGPAPPVSRSRGGRRRSLRPPAVPPRSGSAPGRGPRAPHFAIRDGPPARAGRARFGGGIRSLGATPASRLRRKNTGGMRSRSAGGGGIFFGPRAYVGVG